MAEEAKVPEQPTQAIPAAHTTAKKAPATCRFLLGIKRGMTQLFSPEGQLYAVTEIEAGPCTVLRIRDEKKDGYKAVQLGFGPTEEKRLSGPLIGQFKKTGHAFHEICSGISRERYEWF